MPKLSSVSKSGHLFGPRISHWGQVSMGGLSLSHGTYSQGGFWLGLKDLLPECGCQPGPGCGWGLGRAMSSGSSSYGLPTWPGLPYSTGLGAKELLSGPCRRRAASEDFALKVRWCHFGTTLAVGCHEELLFQLQAAAV